MTTTDGPVTPASPPPARDAPAGGPSRGRIDPAALAALVDERDFLLRSLDDLEREHDAGDVGDDDYETLKDDYTARAARAIRAIEAHQARTRATRRPRSARRLLVTVAGVAAFAVLAGVLVAQASGRRGSGDALTGDIRESTRTALAEALQQATEGDYAGAVTIYDEVLADDPTNVEALTYKGWFLFLDGDSAGIDSLVAATEADPGYPATHAFLAVILDRARPSRGGAVRARPARRPRPASEHHGPRVRDARAARSRGGRGRHRTADDRPSRRSRRRRLVAGVAMPSRGHHRRVVFAPSNDQVGPAHSASMDRRSFRWLTELRLVSTVRAPEAAVSTFARFVTEDGVPGVQVA